MLKSQPIRLIPAETARVIRTILPKGNPITRLRDEFGAIYEDTDFAEMFSKLSQPAIAPWRLALVTVFQFLENLTDRQAAQAVLTRLDWKYALSLEITDPSFDFSVLSEFRARLVEGKAEHLLLDKMLARFREQGLLRLRGRQRTDATHVLYSVRTLNRLELLGETFRAALNELARVAPEWLKPRIKQHWLDWFVHRVEEHRIVKGKEAREAQAIAIGEDGFDLLDALEKDQAVCVCLEQPALKALKLIWEQQYEKVDGKLILPEFERLPSDRVRSPFDLKGCYGKKREKTWVGYKVHLTEACDKDAPSIITNVLVTKASAQEMLAARQVHERLKQNQIVPEEHFLDAGYVSADLVLQCREEGIEIVGPMAHNSTWQHVANKGFALDDFKIDWDKKSVTCPKGKTSKSWTELKSKQGPPMIYTHFSPVDCQSCRSKKHCTKARTQGRGLSFRPKESHELLRKRRAKQKTEQWKVLYSTGRDRGHHLPIGENARASCLTLQGYGQDSATVGGHGSGHQRFEGIQLA